MIVIQSWAHSELVLLEYHLSLRSETPRLNNSDRQIYIKLDDVEAYCRVPSPYELIVGDHTMKLIKFLRTAI